MSGLASLPYCLALALLAGIAVSQVHSQASNKSFDFFLLNVSLADRNGLQNNTSQTYTEMVAKIKEYLATAGGESETILVSNGSDCVKISITWTNGNQTILAEMINRLQIDGFTLLGQTWRVSLTGCAGPTVLKFTFYVVDMPWLDNFTNHSSMEYKQVLQVVTDTFSTLGGAVRAVEIAKNSGCVKVYVEWDTQNSSNIMQLSAALVADGITVGAAKYKVQTTPCSDGATLLNFQFYAVNMTWSKTFKNHSSDEYLELLQDVKTAFADLGGSIRALEIDENFGCVEFYVEWDVLNLTIIVDLTSEMARHGVMLMGQNFIVQTQECKAPPREGNLEASVLKLTFYVANMTWLDYYKDHNSTEFRELKQIIQETFSNLGGSLRALEIAKNYGCLQIYLEWDALNVSNIMDVYSMLKKNGITYMGQKHEVKNEACEIPPADINECSEVSGNSFGICIDGCNDTDVQRQCYGGLKCCSNGCGRTCQRVGYTLKMNATILIDLRWMESMDNHGSSYFLDLGMAAKSMFALSFNGENSSIVSDVELVQIRNYTVEGKSLSLLDTVIYLVHETPNEKLELGRVGLLKLSFNISNGYFRVVDAQLGRNSASPMPVCGGHECYGICKELRSSIQYCSCSSAYVGSDCADFDCRTETNTSLCENGGECAMNKDTSNFECRCKDGFAGSLCQISMNSCPIVPAQRPGLYGLCQSTCMDGNCSSNEMCCKGPCGGKSCVEVGYFQKMLATVTIDFPFDPEMTDGDNPQFQIMKSLSEDWITSVMQQNNVRGFKSAKIVGIKSSTGQDGTSNSVLQVELRFTSALKVRDLYRVRDQLLAPGNRSEIMTLTILNITLGSGGNCPVMACDQGSICVTGFGGELQCACPENKSGQLCDITNCKPHGTDLCQNGGTCSLSDGDEQLRCNCRDGFSGELCEEFTFVCSCLNGGTCQKTPMGQSCICPEGFSGTICENALTHCRSGQPLMTTSGEQQCRRSGCPTGFMCNVDPIDRWTACCFQEDFLCDQNPCQAGGKCVSQFNSWSVCQCPAGTTGLFCEQVGNVAPTECQKKQLFSDWVIHILTTGMPSLNITLENIRVILHHQGYQYVPTDLCDEQGNFKSVATGVLVINPSMSRTKLCLDKSGDLDPACGTAVCDVLSLNGNLPFCLNGGICLGEITRQLCDCSGTGYHGIRCEISGEGVNETSCTIRRDISNLAVEILKGSANLDQGLNKEVVQNATRQVLEIYKTDNIFVPYCDDMGQFEYRGCLYELDDLFKKNCYCALESGDRIPGSEENPLQPPLSCIVDPSLCPKEWGENCEQPDWWCSDKLQCQPDSERCVYYTGCAGAVCTQKTEVVCVAKHIVLPCDLHNCKDDPFSMCQPCGMHGTCYNVGNANTSADLGYTCKCKNGFAGDECQIDENICSELPKGLCKSRCIGDVRHGQLCECDPGYGGIFCDKPARSPCEKRKALYGDAMTFLKVGISPWYGLTVAELQAVVTLIVEEEGANQIPDLNCTDNGFYYKVQCKFSGSNFTDHECSCVDYHGRPISSNVKPYIGYDVCTAPTDTMELAPTACNAASYLNADNLTVCLNGGTCIFEMYAGKFCSCPVGYYGQFCQHQGNVSASAEPRSLCNFFADLWNIANEISTGRADWVTSDLQKYLYLNLSLNFLQLQNNQSYALKPECNEDGTLKKAACYHNIMTGERQACYCWSYNGMIVEGKPVDTADTDMCADMQDSTCPKMRCHYICEHGYRKDNTGCQTCDCKNPCEDMTCGVGHRCVIENLPTCNKDALQMTCSRAVCMAFDKPGACPDYSPEYFREVLESSTNSSSSCIPTCFDDTDCQGTQKCCGLCGNTCIEPEMTYSCDEYQSKMKNQLAFINMARDELMTNRNPFDMQALERIIDICEIWIPTCAKMEQFYEPLQCQHTVDKSGELGNVSSCFCVDFLGNKVEEATANQTDPLSCTVKPFTCPFVEPSQLSGTTPLCMKDYDCTEGQKCCSEKSGYQVCQDPVDTSKLMTTLDKIMSTLCEDNSYMCQGGSRCVKTWPDKGIACECPDNRVGPFCEQLVTDVVKIPSTACERKNLSLKVFIEQLMESNSSLSFNKLLNSISNDDDMQFSITTAIWYQCMGDGTFAPKQCVVNGYDGNGESPRECFCVYENGTEILGARALAQNGKSPLFCGEDSKTCPSGNASRDDSGMLIECSNNSACSAGYACSRSTYGRLVCCPTTEDHICKQPKDVGMRCSSDVTGMHSGINYYYDESDDTCKNFTYNGCEGNRNRFNTLQKCSDTCIKVLHPGTCPSVPVNVTARMQCTDQCSTDHNCTFNYKCCLTTCGKRCIPGNGASMCPIGYPLETVNGGNCNQTSQCGLGAMCVRTGAASGICCPDYRVNQCLVPPTSQSCQKMEQSYFYNATSKMCETMSYTGCDPVFNTFGSLEECCATCNGEGRCKKGMCQRVSSETVSTCVSTCFADGDCPGKAICCSNGCGTHCVMPEVEVQSDCKSRQMAAIISQKMAKPETNVNGCDLTDIPECDKDGMWARLQCHSALGICWCVTPQGKYIPDTITRGVANCNSLSQSDMMRANQSQIDIAQLNYPACINGQEFYCCSNYLCDQSCMAHPGAVCRINPCGGCKAEFYNAEGRMLNCSEGLTSCQRDLKLVSIAIQEHEINEMLASGQGFESKNNSDYRKSSDIFDKSRSLSDAYPDYCQLQPDTGFCKGFRRQWYFDPDTQKCNMFIWGMCEGNDNRFDSPEECYDSCHPSSNPCLSKNCSASSPVCKLQYDEECYTSEVACNITAVCSAFDSQAGLVKDLFVPKCQTSGEYSRKQCHGSYCWCVSSAGQYVNGLTAEQAASLTCSENGTSQVITDKDRICPNSVQPNIACMKACTNKVCPGQPNATCVVDLCSSDCITKFVDNNGTDVKCTGDICKVFSFEKPMTCNYTAPCPGGGAKECPDSVCETAMKQNCSKNLCAVCKVNSCTCQPYFVDVITGNNITEDSCKYLSVGLCKLKKCAIMKDNLQAKYSNSSASNSMPDCDDSGVFKPVQCQGQNCQCVDQFGNTTERNADGSCKKVDKIRTIKVTFTFQANFTEFRDSNKLQVLVDSMRKKLEELGINPQLINDISQPYEGSIKLNVTVENGDTTNNIDLAQILQELKQKANTGDLDITINGQPLRLTNLTEDVRTESQVAGDGVNTTRPSVDTTGSNVNTARMNDGLTETEKIIIGVVCGGVGLIIIAVIAYCVCCRKRKQKEQMDDSFDTVRESKVPKEHSQIPAYNQVFEDDRSVKVRL